VVAVPGSDIAIRLIARILHGQSAGLLTPIYSGHIAAWPEAVPVSVEDAGKLDVLICANPNNPDGRVIAPGTLRGLAGQLIVDEAFADALPQASILPDRGSAIVLRSFGKFFGLAGVRLGFVIADSCVTVPLRAMLGDWPISGPAIAIATRAYRDASWHQMQRERLQQASARLHDLVSTAGLTARGSTPLFQLASHAKAATLFQTLGEAGILVRPFTETPAQLRFGLPASGTEFARLAQAFTTWSSRI
jgi:cobalamin biosynthesis protein CobC